MNKNNIIENVMKKAYLLYKELSEEGYPVNLKMSLDVAKDVHEIKKGYINIIKGWKASSTAIPTIHK